jgi:hypothetical protein
MPAIKVSMLSLYGLLTSVCPGSPAFATDFTCSGLILTRTVPGASAAEKHSFSDQAKLHLSIDEIEPSRSKMHWTGDPAMEGPASDWPPDTRLIVEHGIIAASFAAFKGGVSSVGSLTIDAGGAFRATESALLPKGVLYDTLEGTCQKDRE